MEVIFAACKRNEYYILKARALLSEALESGGVFLPAFHFYIKIKVYYNFDMTFYL